MLMHTRGILVMTPESAMVLTGKQALDFAGGVSAEDNFGIGGYDRIMGPNGQAQYWAPDLAGACAILLRYYEHAYVAPGERFPRRAETARRARPRRPRVAAPARPAPSSRPSATIFSDETEPGPQAGVRHPLGDARRGRRRPRAARALGGHARRRGRGRLGRAPGRLAGVADRHRVAPDRPLRPGARRRPGPVDVGHAVPAVLARRSRARSTPSAAAGRSWCWPTWRASTARRSRCASWQLEYGAEIGRAIVNFRGPIVFCVISRYHGGAFVVFSQRLNEGFEAIAVEGAHASVIGGSRGGRRRVHARRQRRATRSDPRIAELDERIEAADGAERQRLRAERATLLDDRARREDGRAGRRSSTRSTRSSARSRSARSTGSSPPPSCGPT